MRQHRVPKLEGRSRTAIALATLCLAMLYGCANYSGRSLTPGQSTLQDVVATMGKPAAQWTEPDGSMQLSYPRGPAGSQSYMVYLDAAGRMERIENVMDPASFHRISPGMTQEKVLRILGPSVPEWTSYFKAQKQLVWEWRYCNEYGEKARFDVVFDGNPLTVRTSSSTTELCAAVDSCICSH